MIWLRADRSRGHGYTVKIAGGKVTERDGGKQLSDDGDVIVIN